jgi:hypothetical protein
MILCRQIIKDMPKNIGRKNLSEQRIFVENKSSKKSVILSSSDKANKASRRGTQDQQDNDCEVSNFDLLSCSENLGCQR